MVTNMKYLVYLSVTLAMITTSIVVARLSIVVIDNSLGLGMYYGLLQDINRIIRLPIFSLLIVTYLMYIDGDRADACCLSIRQLLYLNLFTALINIAYPEVAVAS